MQQQDELLRAADGKGRHDNLASARGGAVDDVGQTVGHQSLILVQAVAVGALHDEVVGLGHRLRIAEDGEIDAPDVAGKDEADSIGFHQH